MAVKRWAKRIALAFAGLAVVVLLSGFLLEIWIDRAAASTASSAMASFPGGPAEALIALVDCDSCPLADRNRAVWALGQMRESRALPALRRLHTGRDCSHSDSLCQYELAKAIGKIDGTWGMVALFRVR